MVISCCRSSKERFFREVREALWFCLGENNVPELSGTTEHQGFELSDGVSVWETSLELTSSCDREHPALGCGLTSGEFLFINYFKVKAKRSFVSSHT